MWSVPLTRAVSSVYSAGVKKTPDPKATRAWSDQEYAEHLLGLLERACSELDDAGAIRDDALRAWWSAREEARPTDQ